MLFVQHLPPVNSPTGLVQSWKPCWQLDVLLLMHCCRNPVRSTRLKVVYVSLGWEIIAAPWANSAVLLNILDPTSWNRIYFESISDQTSSGCWESFAGSDDVFVSILLGYNNAVFNVVEVCMFTKRCLLGLIKPCPICFDEVEMVILSKQCSCCVLHLWRRLENSNSNKVSFSGLDCCLEMRWRSDCSRGCWECIKSVSKPWMFVDQRCCYYLMWESNQTIVIT